MGGKYYNESTGRCKDLTAKKGWLAKVVAVFKAKPVEETIVRRNRVLSPSMFNPVESFDEVDGAINSGYSTIKPKRETPKENDPNVYFKCADLLYPEDNVMLSPTTALYSTLGGLSTHTLRNGNDYFRIVYKVICGKNKEYSASISCGFLEPNSAVHFTANRHHCEKDTSRMRIRIGVVPDDATDPVEAYRSLADRHTIALNMYAFAPTQ